MGATAVITFLLIHLFNPLTPDSQHPPFMHMKTAATYNPNKGTSTPLSARSLSGTRIPKNPFIRDKNSHPPNRIEMLAALLSMPEKDANQFIDAAIQSGQSPPHTDAYLSSMEARYFPDFEKLISKLPPDDDRFGLKSAAIGDLARYDPVAALSIISREVDPVTQSNAFIGLCVSSAHLLPLEELLTSISRIAREDLRIEAMRGFAAVVMAKRPHEGSRVLANFMQQGNEIPDTVLDRIIRTASKHSIEDATDWVPLIKDAQLREKVLKHLNSGR